MTVEEVHWLMVDISDNSEKNVGNMGVRL